MITLEQARHIALDVIGPAWEADECGEYVVADYGYEDPLAWCLVDGGRRHVVDGDFGCELVGRGSTLVDKETGEVYSLTFLEDPDRFLAMMKVGQHPTNTDPDSIG
jgi:hypothetical protein